MPEYLYKHHSFEYKVTADNKLDAFRQASEYERTQPDFKQCRCTGGVVEIINKIDANKMRLIALQETQRAVINIEIAHNVYKNLSHEERKAVYNEIYFISSDMQKEIIELKTKVS